MKPTEGNYQTATQVNVLSPEIYNIGNGRQFSYAGRHYKVFRFGKKYLAPRGLRQWYGNEWKLQELGRSWQFRRSDYNKENLSFMGVNTHPVTQVLVGSNNRKGRNPDDCQEVGLFHSSDETE